MVRREERGKNIDTHVNRILFFLSYFPVYVVGALFLIIPPRPDRERERELSQLLD
jgi:hypothetical protein